jgi:hypothetical protein
MISGEALEKRHRMHSKGGGGNALRGGGLLQTRTWTRSLLRKPGDRFSSYRMKKPVTTDQSILMVQGWLSSTSNSDLPTAVIHSGWIFY